MFKVSENSNVTKSNVQGYGGFVKIWSKLVVQKWLKKKETVAYYKAMGHDAG